MKKITKISLLALIVMICLSLVACSQKQIEEAVEPVEEAQEEVVEIIDKDIENINYFKDALKKLNFDDVYNRNYYSLEELTVYLMKLFGRYDDAIKKNYQCPYNDVKDENKPVIAYAYANWYITGIETEDLIEINDKTCNNVSAVILRLMGYTDVGDEVDFTLEDNGAISFLKSLGVEFDTASGKVRGDHFIKMLWDVLEAECKDGDSVKDKLIDLKMFKEVDYEDATYLSKGEPIPERKKPKAKTTTTTQVVTPAASDGNNNSGGGGSSSGGSGSGGGGDSGGGDDSGGGGGDSGGGGGDSGGGGGDSGGGGGNELPDAPPPAED